VQIVLMMRRRRSGVCRSLAVALVLSGCTIVTTEKNGTTAALPPAPSEQVATTPKIEPVAPVPAPPQAEPVPELAITVPNPASLIGYDEAALENLLGKPSFTRRDAPAELWQYRNEHCILDLFLYQGATGTYGVEHLEFRETAQSAEASSRCLRAIIKGKVTGTTTG